MTLNSTGLAIGSALPSANLQVSGNALVTHSLAVGGSSLSSSNLNVNGSMGMSVGNISTNTLIPEHSFILANTASGNLTVYLPSANICAGRLVTIKKASTSYDLTIMPMLKNTIDGNVSLGLKSLSDTLPYASLMSSGSNWHILGVTSSAVKTVLPGFTSTWKTDNAGTSASDQITLPLNGTQNFTVYWGDGSSNTITSSSDAAKTHTYSSAGVYQVRIVGSQVRFYFNNTGDKLKILDISQWDTVYRFSDRDFYGCANLTISATDIPDISGTISFRYTFTSCSNLKSLPFMPFWDVSKITNFYRTFMGCSQFNENLSSWVVSSATDMTDMFNGCTSFNQDISSWNVSNVTTMIGLFSGCTSFNQDISSWNASNVTSMGTMFKDCSIFNRNISTWNVSKVTAMNEIFNGCIQFNQDLSSWDVSSVTTFYRAFLGCSAFKQNLSAWNLTSLNPANTTDFFKNVDLNNPDSTSSTANYDALLVSWAGKTLPSGLSINFGTSKYSAAGNVGRVILTGTKGWTITDGGFKP